MPRFQMRRTVYRSQEGWTVSGGARGMFATRIFFQHETAARRVIAKLRADPKYWTTQADFLP